MGAEKQRPGPRGRGPELANLRYFVTAQHDAPVSQQLLAVAVQQAFASVQQSWPSAQHDAAKQQSSPVRQHAAPTRQQSGMQQSAPSAQQARPWEQQSPFAVVRLLLGAAPEPANTTPTDRTKAVKMVFNM